MKITHVAAAIITRPDGAVLLGQRAEGTFYPGYWEFPGGKVEACETPKEALVRELQEELGITVTAATPWLRVEHEYEHAHVCLHFFKVTAWQGEMQDHVHAALAWQWPDRFSVSPMLPANGPMLKTLGLPPFYAVTHAGEIGEEAQLAALELALDQGLKLIQVREPALAPERLAAFAARVVALAHESGARVLINSGDAALVRDCGADGQHLSARQLMVLERCPDLPWVAASCHNPEELARAARLGLDFAVLGAVQETASHPGRPALGWDGIAPWLPAALPVYLIGGLTVADLDRAQAAGAQGVAAIRAAWRRPA